MLPRHHQTIPGNIRQQPLVRDGTGKANQLTPRMCMSKRAKRFSIIVVLCAEDFDFEHTEDFSVGSWSFINAATAALVSIAQSYLLFPLACKRVMITKYKN